ncbi:GTP-binding protein [Neobacillus mesonae]|nr:GTP-binding protein [Neobacillus mesonae]
MSQNELNSKGIPVYILSGFLGSGKTTLLVKLIEYWKSQNLTPAVVMNELGEINLDGKLIDREVPMAELLGGCICCSVRGDMGLELIQLVQNTSPDVIVIEATGAANPVEILDGLADCSLYVKIDVKGLITVVDSIHLLDTYHSQKGKTFRLMQEQIRAASTLLLNKVDRISEKDQTELLSLVKEWNEHASVYFTEHCKLDPVLLLNDGKFPDLEEARTIEEAHKAHHHSHDHVMVYTHYFSKEINSELFEKWLRALPRDIYRAKGIVTFSDTKSRFLFQYAYREPDFTRLSMHEESTDVGVFIGEHFSKTELRELLTQLEEESDKIKS